MTRVRLVALLSEMKNTRDWLRHCSFDEYVDIMGATDGTIAVSVMGTTDGAIVHIMSTTEGATACIVSMSATDGTIVL